MEIILTMKKEKFIDLSTRVIFADFTVYNAYLGLYNVIRFTFEFPATGGVVPKARYHIVKGKVQLSPAPPAKPGHTRRYKNPRPWQGCT